MLAARRLSYLNEENILRKYFSSPRFLLSYSLYSNAPGKKSKATPLQERRMIDRFRLHVKGGEGGSGNASLHRSRVDRYGKPDGGNGGRGGDVILRCTSAVWDFRGLQHHISGGRGGQGASKNKIGSRGEDKVLQVPVGTVIHLVEGEIPSIVEKPTPGNNPWDIPGTLSSESDPTDRISISTSRVSEIKQIEDHIHLSQPHGKSKSTCFENRFFSGYDNDDNYHEINGSMSEDYSEEEKEIEYNFAELTEEGQQIVIARGGEGGLRSISAGGRYKKSLKDKNHNFQKNPGISNDDPNMKAGLPGSQASHIKPYSQPHGNSKSTRFENGFFSGYDNDDTVSEDYSEDEEEIQYNFAELTEEGQQIIIARGGEGGLGSISAGRRYKKSLKDKNQKNPGISDDDEPNMKLGLPGSQASLILELKSIADVGLVGMPNAGKSTLLGAISRAKPIVGNYAFTTLRPNIGKLNYDEVSISVADIPGLIKGAHKNRGLGHAFLRHIERTKVLAYVVDLGAGLKGKKGISPWEQLRDLVLELEYYQEGLSDRPSLVVANKIDEVGAESVLKELERRVRDIPIYGVCAVLEEGIEELKTGLKLLVNGGEDARIRLDNILVN